jgi:hypothetical protein
VVCVHGDDCESFANAVGKSGIETVAPRIGDVLEI